MPEIILPPSSNGIERINQMRGTELRQRADRLTAFRDTYSPVLGFSVSLDSGESKAHTLVNTAATAYFEYTDYVDGKLARQAAELLAEETTPEGGEADHKADKKKFYSQIIGLIVRSVVHEKDIEQTTVVLTAGVIQAARDKEMQKTRDIALKKGIKANARDLGKYKTLANGIGNGLLTLKPALSEKHQRPAKIAGYISLGIGTALSIAALIDMKLHVKRSIKTLGDDTIQGHSSENRQARPELTTQPVRPYVEPRSLN